MNILLTGCTGFIGSNEYGHTTNLSRNGSDLSATVIGSCLKPEQIIIYKDVDGIMTCDPQKVPFAKLMNTVNYKTSISNVHNLSMLAGYTAQKEAVEMNSVVAKVVVSAIKNNRKAVIKHYASKYRMSESALKKPARRIDKKTPKPKKMSKREIMARTRLGQQV